MSLDPGYELEGLSDMGSGLLLIRLNVEEIKES